MGDDGNDYFFRETGLSQEIYVKDGDKVEFGLGWIDVEESLDQINR